MPTINQQLRKVKNKLGKIKKSLKKKKLLPLKVFLNHLKKVKKNFNCPQKSGSIKFLKTKKPKKPNSANRFCIGVLLSNGVKVTAYVPGEGHSGIQEFKKVLLQGGRTAKDVPGIKFKVVPGAKKGNVEGVEARRQGRSRYGRKKPEKT